MLLAKRAAPSALNMFVSQEHHDVVHLPDTVVVSFLMICMSILIAWTQCDKPWADSVDEPAMAPMGSITGWLQSGQSLGMHDNTSKVILDTVQCYVIMLL